MDLPRGFTSRTVDVDDPRDIDAALALVSSCELAGVGWTDATRESVASQLGGPLGWRDEHRFVLAEGTPVALLAAELDRPGREVFVDAFAVGSDAAALQRILLSHAIAATVQLADEDVPSTVPDDAYALSADIWQVVAGSYAQDSAYRAVIEGLGFRPIRRFWRMLKDLTGAPLTVSRAPAGVVRRVVDGEADRRLLHALYEETFAEHFGMTHDEPFEEWIDRLEAAPGNDPAGWWIAELNGEPVGLCVVDDSRAEFGRGYVRTLGVVPAARGRGIARWLLECASSDAVARGRTAISLAVDGENTTGATALYESVGYATEHVIDVWCYPLLRSADSR